MKTAESSKSVQIEVTPGIDQRAQSDRIIGPDIAERLTARLLVHYITDVPPMFQLEGSLRTAAVREFGYRVLGLFEAARQLVRRTVVVGDPPTSGQRVSRRMRSGMAARWVLPEARPPLELNRSTQWNLPSFGFEATRRVFKFQRKEAPIRELVCHVFAEVHSEATDRLLQGFVRTFQTEIHLPASVQRDLETDLCLWGKHSGRLIRVHYCEIVIASVETLQGISTESLPPWLTDLSPDTTAGSTPPVPYGHVILGQPNIEGMQDPLVDDRPYELPGDSALFAEFDEHLYEQVDSDWKFVAGKINEAISQHRPLDEAFVETVTQQRYELAQGYSYPDRPEAGPTPESSRDIVQDILEIHLLAIEQQGSNQSPDS